jgi:hypothetical protein
MNITIFILVSIFTFVFLFLWSHKRSQLKKFDRTAQKRREQFKQDLNLKREQIRQDMGLKAIEVKKNFQHKLKKFDEDFQYENKEHEIEIQQQRKEFEKKILTEYKEGWFHATLFWFFVFILALYADDITNILSTKKPLDVSNKNILSTKKPLDVNNNTPDEYSLTVNTIPKDSMVKIMNIVPKYKNGIRLQPGQYIIQVESPGYSSRCRLVIVKDSNMSIDVTLEKLPEEPTKENYTLTVRTKPPDSTVKVIGVTKQYAQGIQLPVGQYVIKLKHRGYFNQYQCVAIKDDDVSIKVSLKEREIEYNEF